MMSPHRLLSRGLAIGVVTALAALVWLAVLNPLRDWHDRSIEQASDIRQSIDRLNQSLIALEQERAALTNSHDLGLIWRADQSGQVSALIQSQLSEIASKTGLSLRSITPLPPRDIPLAEGVGFRVELEAPLDLLVPYLVEIEHSTPVLSIDRATLRRLVRPSVDNATTGPRLPELFVQLDILAPVQLAPGPAAPSSAGDGSL